MNGSVRVRVPATSANLGPGYDALGLALFLHDMVEAHIGEPGLTIEVAGEGEATAAAGESHLVVRAMRVTFGLLDGQPPGLGTALRQPDPAWAGAWLLRGGGRLRGAGRPCADRRRRRADAPGRRAEAGLGPGGPPGQRGRVPVRGADHRLDRRRRGAGDPAGPAARHRAAGPGRAGAAGHRDGPRRAAAVGSARRCRGQRRSRRPAGRRAHQHTGKPSRPLAPRRDRGCHRRRGHRHRG